MKEHPTSDGQRPTASGLAVGVVAGPTKAN